MPKKAKHGPSKWIAKREDPEAEAGITLEELQATWEALPDEQSASNADYYFNSYAHFGIHEDMLKDKARTGSYMKAIVNNPHLFEGKTVLDVGSGTGILCLFAAKAGAKRCIGVECSDIIDFARKIADTNGYGETITYVRGKIEEVELPVAEVDIIVSEWMGYFLIYESMLDSVLFARDKWLRKGGLLFPDRAKIYMAAAEDFDYKEEKIGFWGQLWGFDFTPMQKCVLEEPISDVVSYEAIATSTACILDVDLTTCCLEDLDFFAEYSLKVERKESIHALIVWFDVSFEACKVPVVLSTAPNRPYTHWKQSVLYLEEAVSAYPGEELRGRLAVRKNAANPRDLDVKLSYEFKGKYPVAEKIQFFRLR